MGSGAFLTHKDARIGEDAGQETGLSRMQPSPVSLFHQGTPSPGSPWPGHRARV